VLKGGVLYLEPLLAAFTTFSRKEQNRPLNRQEGVCNEAMTLLPSFCRTGIKHRRPTSRTVKSAESDTPLCTHMSHTTVHGRARYISGTGTPTDVPGEEYIHHCAGYLPTQEGIPALQA